MTMSCREWREKGFLCIFRDEWVYLCPVNGPNPTILRTNLTAWREERPENFVSLESRWPTHTLTAEQRADLKATALLCYCDKGGLCDFCSNTRTATSHLVGEKIHIDTDHEEWGRVACDAVVMAHNEEEYLVDAESIRATVYVPIDNITPLA